jgi:hypothetical protein
VTPVERYVLGLIAEEAGEALQLIGTALRFGLDTPVTLTSSARALLFDPQEIEFARDRKLSKLRGSLPAHRVVLASRKS